MGNGKEMFLLWNAIRVIVNCLQDTIHVEKGFRDLIRGQQVFY